MPIRRNAKNCFSFRGFTVIEIALVLLISGIIFSIFINLYSNYISQQDYITTVKNLEAVDDFLVQYYGARGRFPCPADPTLPPTHPDYGRELDCGSFAFGVGGQCSPSTNPRLSDTTPSNVICTNIGTRDLNNDGNNEYALIGILPFRTLAEANITGATFSETISRDGYNMRFTYAVTEVMADKSKNIINPANPAWGVISVFDENNIPITEPPSSAYYVILSHGQNRKGGYNELGMQIDNCDIASLSGPAPPGLNDPSNPIFGGEMDMENENCDFNDGVFRVALRGLANNVNYFDDVVAYRNFISLPIWLRALSPDPTLVYLYNNNIGNVGVGTDAPIAPLHVLGDLIADTSVRAEEGFCDLTRPTDDPADGASECLRPEFIAGGSSSCPASQVAVGFRQNQLICEPLFLPSPNTDFDCGLDVLDIDGDGNTTEPMFATGLIYNRSSNSIQPTGCRPL